ncbi:MAG: dihydroxy-acid dehydratase, partial [Leptotrichiaceae bacterium]
MRSDDLKTGEKRAPHRSLLKGLGFINEEMDRPIIGIANSFNEIIPGHVHLKTLVQAVKDGIRNAGGIPMEFNTIGICDGLA